ncbi:hypothetical protein UlMin_027876 [Ulmus minor]
MRFHLFELQFLFRITNVSRKPTPRTGFVHKHHLYSFSTILSKPHQNLEKGERTSKSLVYFNTQITKHGRNGNIREAESVFLRMPSRNIISWTAMLTAYAQSGDIVKAQELFDKMLERNIASYNAMITAYVRNSMVKEAFELFSRVPERNAVSYAGMITGFVRAGMLDKAEKLYFETPVELRDPACSNTLINGYLKMGRLDNAFSVFDGMLDRDVVSWSSMVDGYCKFGRIADAKHLFDKMPNRNFVSWTSMIDGFMKSGNFEEAFELFLEMRREGTVEVNPVTLTVMFEGCGSFARFREGIQMHGLVLRMGMNFEVFLGNSIIIMYSRFGCIDAAAKMFHNMSRRDVVSWNSLIEGYVRSSAIEDAFKVFEIMPVKDVVSWTTIISGFFNKGLTEKAIELFKLIPRKDSVSWTALISGFVNNEEYEEAFRWFTKMLRKAFRLNPLTLSSMLSASAGLANINQGLQVHALAIKMDMEFDLSIQNGLVSMYSKCGNVHDACKIFVSIDSPNTVSFNSMITGFAQNGLGKEALDLFSKMQNERCEVNEITFLGVLSACVHVGLVEEGWKYFNMMKSVYHLVAEPNHYACMVDLLGRAGLVDEAMELISLMPFEPNVGVWGALLSAGRAHLRFDLAHLAAQRLIELEPDNATPYVVLSSVYSISGKSKDGDQVRMTKKLKGIKKSPGCSWIVVKDKVHLFLAGDQSHMDMEEIKVVLQMIVMEMIHPIMDFTGLRSTLSWSVFCCLDFLCFG